MAQRNGSGVPGTGPARSARRAIFWGGVICGVLDISSAIIIALANGGSPVRMLQGIAGALLGPVTFQGGAATAALGLAMHFGVAFTATAVFYWLSRRFPVMVEWAVPSAWLRYFFRPPPPCRPPPAWGAGLAFWAPARPLFAWACAWPR
jgi:hypothetical protein